MVKQFCAGLAAALCIGTAQAESPDEFVGRVKKAGEGLSAVVNLREDKSLGSIAVGIPPKLMADRAKAGDLLAELGKYGAANKFSAYVLAPSQDDLDYAVSRIKEAGVGTVTTRLMAEMVSIKTTRVFLTPQGSKAGK